MIQSAIIKLRNAKKQEYLIGMEENILYISKVTVDVNGTGYLCRIYFDNEKDCYHVWKFFKKQKWYAAFQCPVTHFNFSNIITRYGSSFAETFPIICQSQECVFMVFQNNIIWKNLKDKKKAKEILQKLTKKENYDYEVDIYSDRDRCLKLGASFNDYIVGNAPEHIFLETQKKYSSYEVPEELHTKRTFILEKPSKIK